MNQKPFKLERYFAKYEFTTKYLLSSSDCDGLRQSDLLAMADSETKEYWDNLSLGYTDSLGSPLLRHEIAKLYRGITPAECLVVVPEEGILIAINSILTSNDNIICTYPGYQSLYAIAEAMGCEITKWKPDESNGWRFNPDFLEKNIKRNTKMIIVNFPHNPTGFLPTKADFQRIIDIAEKNNIVVLSDEMYRYLEYDQKDRLPSACEIYDKAISLFGMSKTFGMAGVRIGWVVTKDKKLYQKMATIKDYTTICSSAPSEILSVIALRAKDRIINDHIAKISANLELLDKFFEQHNALFEWVKPKAGTIGFPRLIGKENSLDFCQNLVRKANIMLLPSTVYEYDNKHFRLGFGRENLPEAIREFGKYLNIKSSKQ